jgi:hypothetical protein
MALTNTDSVDLYFALYSLNDTGDDWEPVTVDFVAPLNVDGSLPPDGTFNMILADNLYKIFISDVAVVITDPITDPGYYILADMNIKACKKELILKNLCPSVGGCDPIADRKWLEKRLRFHDLEQGLYFIYSKWIQYQALTMLIVPTNQELLSMREYLDQLLAMCNCSSTECKQCSGGYISVSNWTNQSTSDCGCS